MPPKKDNKKATGNAAGQPVEEDLSDIAELPQLNTFIFMNLYSFKYRKNLKNLEKLLLKEFHFAPEGETAEQAKRNRVIQQAELLVQAKGKQYLTEEEINDLSSVDATKLQQVFAKCTNEILASIIVPLRRAKAEEVDVEAASLEKMNEEQKAEALEARKNKAEDTELTLWLKDFPKTAGDFKEMRRSAEEHMPQLEVALQGVFLIEEGFKVEYDDEDDGGAFIRADSTLTQIQEEEEADRKKAHEELPKEGRVAAFCDLLELNKFARGCLAESQLRFLAPQKIKFSGPDPPQESEADLGPDATEQPPPVAAPTSKNSKKDDPAPVEVPKSEEELAEEKQFNDFVTEFRKTVTDLASDVQEYRALQVAENGPKKVPLFPKTWTRAELEALKDEEAELRRKAAEEAEKQRIAEEEAAKAAVGNKKGAAKGKAGAKPDSKGRPGSRAAAPSRNNLQSSKSNRSTVSGKSRPDTSQLQKRLEAQKLRSVDDDPKEWDFSAYNKVLSEMKCESASIGSVLAALMFQIEEDNKDQVEGIDCKPRQEFKEPTPGGFSQMSNLQQPVDEKQKQRDALSDELDDMFQKLTFEHAVVKTDFKHIFSKKLVRQDIDQSPYQILFNQNDKIGVSNDSYTFMNGANQGKYEYSTLQKMELPGINDRFGMPKRATRRVYEREADTSVVHSFLNLPVHETQRLIALKAFEKLLSEENPEREYNFLDRNYEEKLDAATFRQVLSTALRLNPDVNTSYFDKEDALLLAVNFKNPPGRLLRRQWTQPIKVVPDFPTWRKYVKGENVKIEDTCIDIQSHKVGMLRTNSKYCFPCDNSIIRVDKNYVGARRIGTSVVQKDNLIFGIKESQKTVDEKVDNQDELPNLETRKSIDRRCEFWMEFENGARLHVEMQDAPETRNELIPQQTNILDGQTLEQKDQIAVGSNKIMVTDGDKSGRGENTGRDSKLTQSEKHDVSDIMIDNEESFREGKEEEKSQILAPQADESYNTEEGSSLTMTFKEGLVVQTLPNGNVQQTIVKNDTKPKKQAVIPDDDKEEAEEVSRTVTREGALIRQLKDGNQIIYLQDGTITVTDHRKGIWTTTNSCGVVRQRNLRQEYVQDAPRRLEIVEKVDPETNAKVYVREDGVLKNVYPDRTTLLIMPDHTQILITKTDDEDEDSAIRTTLFSKTGYAPVRLIYDPVKERAATVIGLGGTDALMGKDSIMERSHGGLITEVLLPDRSIMQTYLEKQELQGYNRFSKSLVHLVRRDDFSVIKVRQDGEVVVITSNERAYLNDIGKNEEFGTADYDYFFELFGVPIERRSGVYTSNLEQGRLWTQDEEGNFFMIYANGDSTEKLSVSFDLDQMIEGIDNKEPSSPRVVDGEYIEEECKFMPPPKTVAHPRLFLVRSDGASEFMNSEQLEYLFRCQKKDDTVIKRVSKVKIENESATSHHYMRLVKQFDPTRPSHLPKDTFPKIPQALEMVNQTVSIASEPSKERYLWRNIIEYDQQTEGQCENLHRALDKKDELRDQQAEKAEHLKIEEREIPVEQVATQSKLLLRIAKKRGVNVQALVSAEFNQVKQLDADEKRQKVLDSLDDYFSTEREQASTEQSESGEEVFHN